MLGASDAVLERTSDGILEVSALGLSLGPTDSETLGTEEGIILSSSDGEVLGTTLWAADRITPSASMLALALASASASASDFLCSCRDARLCPGRNVIVVLLAIIIPLPILFRLR